MLAGFDPCDEAERQRLAELHRDLEFSPVLEAGRLRDKKAGALRNIKRVLAVLTATGGLWIDTPGRRDLGRAPTGL